MIPTTAKPTSHSLPPSGWGSGSPNFTSKTYSLPSSLTTASLFLTFSILISSYSKVPVTWMTDPSSYSSRMVSDSLCLYPTVLRMSDLMLLNAALSSLLWALMKSWKVRWVCLMHFHPSLSYPLAHSKQNEGFSIQREHLLSHFPHS